MPDEETEVGMVERIVNDTIIELNALPPVMKLVTAASIVAGLVFVFAKIARDDHEKALMMAVFREGLDAAATGDITAFRLPAG